MNFRPVSSGFWESWNSRRDDNHAWYASTWGKNKTRRPCFGVQDGDILILFPRSLYSIQLLYIGILYISFLVFYFLYSKNGDWNIHTFLKYVYCDIQFFQPPMHSPHGMTHIQVLLINHGWLGKRDMCNTGVYPIYILYKTCVLHIHISATHIHLYFYTCNTPKMPNMYYRCSTIGHVMYILVIYI